MYCSHCGKKVGDTMLFCPFCGEAIVIPDQDEPVSEPASPPEGAPEKESTEAAPEAVPEDAPELPTSDGEGDAAAELLAWNSSRNRVRDVWARQEEDFTPLPLDDAPEEAPNENWREEIARRKEAAAPEKKPPEMKGEDEPLRLEGAAPKLELEVEGAKPTEGRVKGGRKPANTLVPPKPLNPGDMFMDDRAAAYDDPYDPYDDPDADESDPEGFVYEDEGESTFFMRHLRGIVGLALFVILILMFVIFAFSRAGQQTLAKVNLAWSTDAYSQLGYQSYQAGDYANAGRYYERALQRDPDNYSFASSAAMAYVEAKDTEKAAAMLKRCVEINPTMLEPYIYLLKLYPDASNRPWDVTQIMQQGYRQTGDSRLNVAG